MLKKIILKDFESHEHTVIEDLSDGFNLICGESNAGKTSIVRAIRLAAYNDFDPASVRVGCTKCEVTLETERGTVKVTRGPKDNLWEVTPKGQPTQYFDKVGVKVVPQAAEIIGLNVITLGDVQIPVNIMDQLESHFMLAGVGDKNATGSMRAQIIDEISGLSGIEGLIKSVSLDNTRFGREVSELEEKMEEAQKQLHPEQDINREKSILERAEAVLKEADEYTAAAKDAEVTLTAYQTVLAAVTAVEQQLAGMPDAQAAKALLVKAEGMLVKAKVAGIILSEITTAISDITALTDRYNALPDSTAAKNLLIQAEKDMTRASVAYGIHSEWQIADGKVAALETRLAKLQGTDASREIAEAQAALDSARAAEKLLSEVKTAKMSIMVLEAKLKECDEEMQKNRKELDELLATVKVCPLTMKPVSQECLEEAK